VLIRAWEPATAPAEEIRACRDVYNASFARDLPGDPPWGLDGLREWLAVEPPGEAYRYLVAEEAGALIGVARIWLKGHENAHSAEVNATVDPAWRRRGIARALAARVVGILGQARRRTVTSEVVEGTDGVPFAEALGLRCALRDPRSLLDLSTLDHRRIDALATAAHPGYVLRCWRDELPEDMLAPYALAKRTMNEAPLGELDAAPIRYDAERIRGEVAIQRRRGYRVYQLVAVHESTGVVAGLTELAVVRIYPTRGDQDDTCVVPAHRGHGLGLWMKAAMLRLLRTSEPGLVDVQTWNAETNAHMLAVNTALGFRRDRMWREYQAGVAELGGILSATTQRAASW